MSVFGCNHDWRNYGRAAGGTQQQTCRRCGRVRNIRVRAGIFHTHSFPVGKRGSVVECSCGATRRV